MKIAIIFFTMLSILGTGSLKLNDDTEIRHLTLLTDPASQAQ